MVQLSQSLAMVLPFQQPPPKHPCTLSPLGADLQRTEEVKGSAKIHEARSDDRVFVLWT